MLAAVRVLIYFHIFRLFVIAFSIRSLSNIMIDTSKRSMSQCENLKKNLPLQFSVKLISVDLES